jgi:hypothetical protein
MAIDQAAASMWRKRCAGCRRRNRGEVSDRLAIRRQNLQTLSLERIEITELMAAPAAVKSKTKIVSHATPRRAQRHKAKECFILT